MPLSEMVAKRTESSSDTFAEKNIVQKQIDFANNFIEQNMGDSINRSARFLSYFFEIFIKIQESGNLVYPGQPIKLRRRCQLML